MINTYVPIPFAMCFLNLPELVLLRAPWFHGKAIRFMMIFATLRWTTKIQNMFSQMVVFFIVFSWWFSLHTSTVKTHQKISKFISLSSNISKQHSKDRMWLVKPPRNRCRKEARDLSFHNKNLCGEMFDPPHCEEYITPQWYFFKKARSTNFLHPCKHQHVPCKRTSSIGNTIFQPMEFSGDGENTTTPPKKQLL